MNVKAIFGENLKHFRKLHKITQEELAEKLDIIPTHLSRIENGKSFVTAELLDALCVIFDISPASFFNTQKSNLDHQKRALEQYHTFSP
ncbi:MAG: helix-turn-helix domain-containing protein, partial [Treponemataceae bacterium]|nr:helix-turn-helix domain-containing protein [Treponemataceae bacterium]